MPNVTDATNGEWMISVTVAGLERVKQGTGFDLCSLITGEPLERFFHDLVLTVNCGYWLVKPQADAQGITEQQFKERFSGDALDSLQSAILDALPDFFPRPRREVLSRMIAELRRSTEHAIAQILAVPSSSAVTKSADVSESIPETTHSDV